MKDSKKLEVLMAFVEKIDDIMCGLIEGANREETKETLYIYVIEHLWSDEMKKATNNFGVPQ